MAGPLYVKVDWNRDGDFTDALEDVSNDQRGTIVASYGRDGSTALAQVSAGRGSFDLDNTTRRYCLEEDAQALVRGRGWQRHNQLKPGDLMLAYDPADDTIVWEPLEEVVRLPWDAPLIRWTSTAIDVATTPEHRWWTVGTSGRGSYVPRFRSTADITGKQIKVMVGGGQPACFSTEPVYGDDFVELLAWVFTEGWFSSKPLIGDRLCARCAIRPARGARGPAVCDECASTPFVGRLPHGPRPGVYTRTGFAQSQTAKPKQVAEIRELVDRLVKAGHPVSERQYLGGTGVMSTWQFSGDLDQQVRLALPGKKLTAELLCSLTCEQAERFLDVLIAADGHTTPAGDRVFHQKDREQLDLVAMLCGMLGVRTAVKPSTDGISVGALSLRKHNRLVASHLTAAEEPYRGVVWCPGIRTGIFLARSRGKTFWTGNSARNAGSPLFGKVKPARPVLITRDVTVGASTTTYTILRAHSDDQPLNPDVEAQRVTMNLVDSLQDLRGITIATPLYTGVRTGDAIGAVLDAAGWTGGRDIDAGATVIPYWWEDGTDAMDALQKLLASEGPPALLTVGAAGEIVFRDRHHRITRAASKTSQATCRGTEGAAEPVMGRGFTYNDGWGNVVNSPTINVAERKPTTTSIVWQSDEIITIGASASYVVVLQSSDPFMNAVTPVAGTDYRIGTGGIASATLSRTSGQSTSITFTATGAGASIAGVQLRAVPVPVARTWQVTASAAAQSTANTAQSALDYGQRGIPSGLEPVWAGRYDAQALADLYVLQRAQPLTVLTVRFVASDLQQLRLAKVLALDLSDRVTVVEPESQVSGDFYVESIAHTIDGVVSHEIILGLEAVPAVPSSTAVFILGTSTLNGSDPLGY